MNADLARALARMDEQRSRLLAATAGLSPADFDRAPRGGWSLRRVLHHVIESEAVYAKLLAYLCGAAAPDLETSPPVDGADAAAKLAATRSAVLALIEGVDEPTLYRLVRTGHEEYSPLSVLQNIAAHDADHMGQIAELAPAPDVRPVSPPAGITLRPARDADLPRLTEIYNHYIAHTPITFDLDPVTVEERRAWSAQFAESGPHRLIVAEDAGVVAGYAGSHRFRTKRAYDTTVETTIYCAPEHTGRGIGAALYAALFDALRGEDLHMAVAGITVPNPASVALHERFGFALAGVMHDVGRKFGRYWDVAWYEKRLRR